MSDAPPSDGPATLGELQRRLEQALELVQQLTADGLLARLLTTFRYMPAEDRPVMVSILEREVLGRLMSRGTERPVGGSTHLNPNARLYVRALDSSFDRKAFDRDGMMIADIRALRIATIIRNLPEIRAMFRDAMREALDHVDQDTWTVAEDLLHDVLGCIDEARTAARAAGPVAEPAPPDESTDTSAGEDDRRRGS